MYLVHQESGKQINLGREALIIAKEWIEDNFNVNDFGGVF